MSRRGWLLTLAAGAMVAGGCGGGDATGPSEVNHSGTYPGTFYVIATSTSPVQRDSINGGPVTLTLARQSGETYEFSATNTSGGSATTLGINSAGALSFPNFDPSQSLEFLGSFLSGICDLSSALATPSGSVVGRRLTVNYLTTGAVCDWSGTGVDIRATHIQLTWTGSK